MRGNEPESARRKIQHCQKLSGRIYRKGRLRKVFRISGYDAVAAVLSSSFVKDSILEIAEIRGYRAFEHLSIHRGYAKEAKETADSFPGRLRILGICDQLRDCRYRGGPKKSPQFFLGRCLEK